MPTPPDPVARLDAAAARLRETFAADLVVVRLAAADVTESAIGLSADAAPAAQALATAAVTGGLPLERGAGLDGAPTVWSRLELDPLVADRPAAAPLAALAGASAVAVRPRGRSGSIAVVRLAGRPPLGADDGHALARLAPELLSELETELRAEPAPLDAALARAALGAGARGVVILDRWRRVAFVNPAAAELLGADPGLVAGRPFAAPAGGGLEVAETELSAAGTRIGFSVEIARAGARRDTVERALSAVAEREERVGRAERRVRTEAQLARAAHALASALTPGDVHRRLLDEAARLVGGGRLAVLVVDDEGGLAPAATLGFSAGGARALVEPAGAGPLAAALRGRRVVIDDDTWADPRWPEALVSGEDVRSAICVPLAIGERVYGALVVGSPRLGAFADRDVATLSELAGHAAAALRNALTFASKRDIADTLQEWLLAPDLPRLPGLSVAALYRAARGAMVGGDFYDVWEIAPGRVAAMVGDVSGKGPPAAAVTAMVRHLVEGLARHESDPATLLHELNQLLLPRLPDEALVTVMLAVHDRSLDRLAWCNAGHPPPLLVRGEGRILELGQPDPPCAAFADATYHRHEVAFRVADQLVMYTDGVTEARRSGEQFGLERLIGEVLSLRERRPAALARGVYAAARLWSEGDLADDVAIAVVRRDVAA